MIAHQYNHLAKQYPPEWRGAIPPDVSNGGRTSGRLRGCTFCGSMHPADLAAALSAGATASWADFKYGWPHKLYVDNVPNPHAGMLETTSSSSVRSERFCHEVREPRYNERTGERVADYVTYTEPPSPAAATTHGKFYTEHLQDASPEDREIIMKAMGLRFTFMPEGKVLWAKYTPPVEADDSVPKRPT